MFSPTTTYLTLPRAPESWIIQDLVPTSGRTLLYGRAKLGKSFLAIQLAAAVGDPTIEDFMGFPIRMHGPVAYLQVDTPRGIWMDRLQQDFMPVGYSLQGLFWADTQTPDLPFPFNITFEGHRWLKEACASLEPVLVVVDTIREIHKGDENESGHMQNVLSLLTDAVRPAALLIIAHSRKQKSEPSVTTEDITAENRGSNYIVGAVDVIMRLASEERLEYQGRSTGLDSVHMKRTSEGLFLLDDPIDLSVQRFISAHPDLSQKGQAERLHKEFPQYSVDSLRSRIRRLQKRETPELAEAR